jgi:hypothetical protein
MEEHSWRVFENRLLRRIFGPKRNEMTGGWRELHNEELHDLYFSPNIIRYQAEEDEVGAACAASGKKRNLCRILVG